MSESEGKLADLPDEEQGYDELDDLLDEDPSKLDQEAGQESEPSEKPAKASGGDPTPKAEDADPEVKEMISELEQEFGKLMQEEGKGDGMDKEEQAENFKQILSLLGEASKTAEKAEVPKQQAGDEPQGFKNVVSKTLERLKENGNKVDSNLAQEEKQRGPEDVLTQLLNQLVEGADDAGAGEGGVDNAILNILNQMSSKEVLYQPMKDMHTEFAKWLDENKHNDQPDMERYTRQYELISQIVAVFERDDYTNEACNEEVTGLLDALEQLGDTPVSKGIGPDADHGNMNELDDIAKMLDAQGGGEGLPELDKELAEGCKQQ